MIYIILLLSIVLAVFLGFKYESKKWDIELIINNINQLRGLMAIFIILSHITLVFDKVPFALLPFSKISTICVGYFFVSSGYGLAWSYANKTEYLKNKFLQKKMTTLLGMYLASLCVFIIGDILFVCFGGESFLHFTPKGIFKTINWYLIMQAILYIIFYVVFVGLKNGKKASWVINIIIFIWSVLICIFFPDERSYYISEQSFGLGLLLFEYKVEIRKIVERFKFIVFGMVAVLCAVSMSAFFVPDATLEDIITHNLLCIAVYLVFIVFYNYFSINNIILERLKNMSFEMYIFQFAILEFYKQMFAMNEIAINHIYVFLVLVTDIMVAYIFTRIKKVVKNSRDRR